VTILKIVAVGLDGSLQQQITTRVIEGVNISPESPEIQNTFLAGSRVGTRIEVTSIVPVESGIVLVSEIRVPGWNIEKYQLQYATVSTKQLVVAEEIRDRPGF